MTGWRLWVSWAGLVGIPATIAAMIININRRKYR